MKLAAATAVVLTLSFASLTSAAPVPGRRWYTAAEREALRQAHLEELLRQPQREGDVFHVVPPSQRVETLNFFQKKAEKFPEERTARVLKALRSWPNHRAGPTLDLDAKKLGELSKAPGRVDKAFDVSTSFFHGFHL